LAIWFTASLGMGARGLAWAQSIVAVVEVAILFYVMSRRIPGLFDLVFVHAVARMASATGFMAAVSYSTVQLFQLQNTDQSFLATFPKFVVIASVSLAAYVWFSRLLKLREADPVIKRLNSVFFGRAR
ncbi:MAG: virulence factor MviN, partial [Candidatus Saccharimonadales bacterium]